MIPKNPIVLSLVALEVSSTSVLVDDEVDVSSSSVLVDSDDPDELDLDDLLDAEVADDAEL